MPDALPEFAIQARGLSKVYGAGGPAPKQALKGIDLDIPRGSFFALLGPNGAGKSTFINIMAGLVNKTAGQLSIWGHDIVRASRRARASIGVVPQELNIDPFFTPRALLELQAGMYGVPARERRTMEILRALGLADKAEAYPRTLSGGMRRRLLVAKAMVHAPPVLVLDEPTAGVDIELRQQLWSYVRDLNRNGTTVLLTTHYLEEAEQLCDRIAIIDHGKVIACDSTAKLVGQLDHKELRIVVDCDLIEVPATLASWNATLAGPRTIFVRYQPSSTRIGALLEAVKAAGIGIVDLSTEEADLEDLFLRLTRRHGAPAPP